MNVRVNREGGYAEGLRHDHTGRFMANARQALQCFHVDGYVTAVFLHQYFTQPFNRF